MRGTLSIGLALALVHICVGQEPLLCLERGGYSERIVLFPNGLYAQFEVGPWKEGSGQYLAVGGGCYTMRGRHVRFRPWNCTNVDTRNAWVVFKAGRIGADLVCAQDSVLQVLFGRTGVDIGMQDGYVRTIRKGRHRRDGSWTIGRGSLFGRYRYLEAVVPDAQR